MLAPDRNSTPHVRLTGLGKVYGDTRAVADFSLEVKRGSFTTLLGPSGCGKTTVLRMVAGFVEPDAGTVSIGGVDQAGRPPNLRGVGMVFQDYALFPHMTVMQNVQFGLKMAKVPAAEAKKRAEEALEMVRLPHVGSRKPKALSGGQRQRVALARALVNRPSVLLLDEPLGALDLKLRRAMQFELKQLQQQVGITFIYVTHDQEEALTMADRIAVMNEGEVLQIGRADQIYEQPTSRFVADFIGETNFVEGALESKNGRMGLLRLTSGASLEGVLRDPDVEVGGPATLAVRPEKMEVSAVADDAAAADAAHTELAGRVIGVHYLGTDARYLVDVGGFNVVARVQNQRHGYAGMLSEGTPVRLGWRTEDGSILS